MNIIILPEAKKHLDGICHFIAKANRNAAVNIRKDIFVEMGRLKFFPEIGAVESVLVDLPQKFRSLIVKRMYKIIYYTEDDTIYISAIWDCRQNPDELRNNVG